MPNYRVFYGFVCPKCGHQNAQRDRTLAAPSKEQAADTIHRTMTCLKCGEVPPVNTRFTYQAIEV